MIGSMSRYLSATQAAELFLEIKDHPLVGWRTLGQSVEGADIVSYQLGAGPVKILAWSQMHGNEPTSTRALADFCRWLLDDDQQELLAQVSFYAIAQLNPDGAKKHRRYNAAGVDLNRDALDLSQPESRLLGDAFADIQPQLCLNLHDQRTVHAAGAGGSPATLSLLAPPVDGGGGSSPARLAAQKLVVLANQKLAAVAGGAVSRFADDYNPNCFGEHFISQGVPTILLEAGFWPGDYQRHKPQAVFLAALKAIMAGFVSQEHEAVDGADYDNTPLSRPEFTDLVIEAADLVVDGQPAGRQDLDVVFFEKFVGGGVEFIPRIVGWGSDVPGRAHQRITFDPQSHPAQKVKTNRRYNFVEGSGLVDLIHQQAPSLRGN